MAFDDAPSVRLQYAMSRKVESSRPLPSAEIHRLLRKTKTHDLVHLCGVYKWMGCWWCNNSGYYMPVQKDKLVSDLAELSLTHVIFNINPDRNGTEIYLIESHGDTNIDAEFIDRLVEEYTR